jgi:hypothetical protein
MSSTSPPHSPSTSASDTGASDTQGDDPELTPVCPTDHTPSPTMFRGEEVGYFPESETSLNQDMAPVSHVPPEPTSNGALDVESFALLTPGYNLNTSSPPLVSLADALLNFNIGNTVAANIPVLNHLDTQQDVTVDQASAVPPWIAMGHIHHFQPQIPHPIAQSVQQFVVATLHSWIIAMMNGTIPDLATMLGHGNYQIHTPGVEAAIKFVKTLEAVDITSILPEDMKCPLCRLPFGSTTDGEGLTIVAYLDDEEREITERLHASWELPFCENRPDNDPVRTPCGHVFGRQCLIDSLETKMTCPMCRCQFDSNEDVLPSPDDSEDEMVGLDEIPDMEEMPDSVTDPSYT